MGNVLILIGVLGKGKLGLGAGIIGISPMKFFINSFCNEW